MYPGTTNYDLTTPNRGLLCPRGSDCPDGGDQRDRGDARSDRDGRLAGHHAGQRHGQCRTYGQYLGNRYKNFPNIIWISGNDFQDWSNPNDDAVVTAVALGIKSVDTNHLQTVELNYTLSSSLDDTNWAPIIGLNGAYTYSPTYDEVLHAYRQSTNRAGVHGGGELRV